MFKGEDQNSTFGSSVKKRDANKIEKKIYYFSLWYKEIKYVNNGCKRNNLDFYYFKEKSVSLVSNY